MTVPDQPDRRITGAITPAILRPGAARRRDGSDPAGHAAYPRLVRSAATSAQERGALAIEMAFAVPAILLIFGLIFAYGRVAQVNGTLEAGTRDAARAATIARTRAEAVDRATAAVREAMAGTPACLDTLGVTLSPEFEAGEPVTVVATCTYSVSDIGLPGGLVQISPSSTFTSMLDPNRGIG